MLSGSVEIAPRLGRADLICDLVSTGSTLAANHLRRAETVLDSQAVLIRTPVPIAAEKQEWTRRLLMRIDGVEQVKGSKYIMLHAPRSALAAIAKLLPGSEAPTVIPLEGRGDRVAVHAVCRESVFWETLEDLKGAGATPTRTSLLESLAGLNEVSNPFLIPGVEVHMAPGRRFPVTQLVLVRRQAGRWVPFGGIQSAAT